MDDIAENRIRSAWARKNWERLDASRRAMARRLLVRSDEPAKAVRTDWRAVMPEGSRGPFLADAAFPEGVLFGEGHPSTSVTPWNAPPSGYYYDVTTHILYQLQG